VCAEYERRITRLLSIQPPVDQDGRPAHLVTFARGAAAQFEGFCQRVESMLAPEGDLAHMSDWGGKFAGAVARVIGILHLAAHSDDPQPWTTPVPASVADDGLAIAEMGADLAAAAAECIKEWARREQLESFSTRDAWRALRGRFGRAAALDAPLAMLLEHGYIREQEPIRRHARGRKPSPIYVLNPSGRKGHNGQNCQRPEDRGSTTARPETAHTAASAG
jgi:hypothetical protein